MFDTLLIVYVNLALYTERNLMPNVLRFVRRSTILESKPGLLEKVVKKPHHNGKVYYISHYSPMSV